MKKYLYHFSRILIGLVFIFSGFVKAVDPMGTAIKFSDYFNYAFDLPGLTPLSLPLSLIMCGIEFALGFVIILNLLPKTSILGAALLMVFFTPLTFYLAVANPVSDCGCFGDAVKLTNWETFWKNIVIDVFIVFAFIWRKDFPPKLKIKTQQIATTIIFLIAFGFEIYNYSYLPIIDFRPYKIGNNIRELMQTPPDAEPDVYETKMVYKNKISGEIVEFPEDNYPWQDTATWQWVETKTKLIKKGYEPPIHDFELIDLYGQDLTDIVLSIPDTTILVVTYTLEEINSKNLIKTKDFIDSFKTKIPKTQVFCVTSSSPEKIEEIINEYELNDWTFCKIDEVTSKTIIRSNPGIVFLKDAVILEKLHYHSMTEKKLKQILKK